MRKKRVIQAICDCRDPRDGKAGLADICLGLGKAADKCELDSLEETLRKEYSGYVDVVSGGGCVRVKPRAIAENARYEREATQFRQWILATVTAVAAVLLGFFLGTYFGYGMGH